jgi:hypothetical protein
VARLLLYCLTVDVELARQQWEDGRRRIEAARPDRRRYGALQGQVDVVVDALRKRVGQVFTLDELADAYDGADEWARSVLEAADPEAPLSPEAGTVADAAFHQFARGAADYRP